LKSLSPSPFGFVPEPDTAHDSATRNHDVPEDRLLSGERYELHRFHSAILEDDRSVGVYLPKIYRETSERRFPVFYLHDGQNVFDGRTSYIPGCTWRAHTTADDLVEAGAIQPVILVGVANTGLRRMAEYTPTSDFKLGGGDGKSYARLLIEELKPLIDDRYRTLLGPTDTGLGGSSLGGLISLYIGLKHPETFGRLAVMSPSLWWDHRSMLNFVARVEARPEMKMQMKIWMDMGTAEGARHLRDADLLYRTLLQHGWNAGQNLSYSRVEGGLHNEEAWARRFGDVLRFLFPPL